MAYSRTVRRTPPAEAKAAVEFARDMQINLAAAGLAVHTARVDDELAAQLTADSGAAVKVQTLANWTPIASLDDAGCQARANLFKAIVNAHLADGDYAHLSTPATAAVAAADCTDVATCTTLLVATMAALTGHLLETAPHNKLPAAVLTPGITPTNAASNILALNEQMDIWQRHVYSSATPINLVGV